MVTCIELWKHENILQKVKIYVSKSSKFVSTTATGNNAPGNSKTESKTIEAGTGRMGKLTRIVVPSIKDRKKMKTIIFSGSYCDGYPFPRLNDIGLKWLDLSKEKP